MRKRLGVVPWALLFVYVLVGIPAGDAAAAATLTIGSERGEAGSTVHVPAALDTDGASIATVLVELSYDSSLLEVSDVVPGDTIENANKTLDFSVYRPGSLRILVYGGVTALSDGAFFAIAFDIRLGAPDTTVPIRAIEASAASPEGNALNFSVGEGQVVIGSLAMVTVTPNPGAVGVGEHLQLAADSTDPFDATFFWTSNNSSVARVSTAGLVTGVRAGTASISARGGNSGVSGSAALRVVYSELVAITPNPILLAVGASLEVTAASESAEDTSFVWETTNPEVATVEALDEVTAEVTAVAAGTAYVTAAGDVSGLQGGARVFVSETPAVLVLPSRAALSVAETAFLTATSTDSRDAYYLWESSDPGVVSVAQDGLIAGVAEGTATITATGAVSDLSGTAEVSVGCAALALPSEVQASDGTYQSGVSIQWSGAEGPSVVYRVYRSTTNNPASAEPLGADWQSALDYFDDTAEPPFLGGIGCNQLPGWTIKRYYYWVEARLGTECPSGLSEPDDGYRGGTAAGSSAGLLAPLRVFPGDAVAVLGAMAVLAFFGRLNRRRTAAA